MNSSIRRLAIAISLASTMLGASVAHAQSTLSNIVKSGHLRVAIPTDFAPYGSVDANFQPQGLDIDMANYVAAKLGVKAELVPVTSANRISYLQTKKVDIVISTLGKSPEREKVIDFSAAYSPFFIAVFGPQSVPASKPADLAGKSIAVTRGSMDDLSLTAVAPAATDIHRFEDNSTTISAYASGQTQLVATSVQVADAMIKKNPDKHTTMRFVLKVSPNYIGLNKGEPDLLAKLNQIIATAKQNGDLDKLSQKWLGRPTGDLPN